MNTEVVFPFGGAMGQVFHSDLAGHLFTARGTERPDRISDTYFAEERRRRLGFSIDGATESPASSVDARLPTFSHEEIVTATEALRSQGIILPNHHLPSHGSSIVPHIASLACLRLQPPDFAIFGAYDVRTAKAPQKLACFQLMLLVAYDWWDMLSNMLDQFYETLAIVDRALRFRAETYCWVRALSLACSRGHENALRCLLEFFVPKAVDTNGRRCKPKILEYKYVRCNLLGAIAWHGLGRAEHRGGSKLYLPPKILEQLHHYFADIALLTTNTEQGSSPLEIALQLGDGMLSELYMSWIRPSDFARLVLPDSGVYLLVAACQGKLLTWAKYIVEAGDGDKVSAELWAIAYRTHLHSICEDPSVPSEETLEWVTLFYELGVDLCASSHHDGRTLLHLAAASGKVSVVRYIISRTHNRQQRHPKDQSGKTPLMLAKSAEVMHEFAPWQPNSDGDATKAACYHHSVPIQQWPRTHRFGDVIPYFPTVYQILYEQHGSGYFEKQGDDFLRWIHVPANNVEWCEDLLLRWLLDGDGDRDIQNYEAAQQAFNQQHLSPTPQGRFFRPGVYCTRPSKRIVFIASPYIDFETSSNVEQMQKALQQSDSIRPAALLYNAYISSAALHPRRTLDQYLYYNMDTSERDTDQVIQRYQKAQSNRVGMGPDARMPKNSRGTSSEMFDGDEEETTIMVDQLWMWILGDGLIITCGAERWNADPIISARYQGFFPRLQDSLYSLAHGPNPNQITAGDFAMQFMTACSGTFDRHARGTFNLQFMSMFEQSIGVIGAKDSDLLRKFSTAYTALKNNKGVSRETFVKALNDLTTETDLLTELKDIRDELHIMNTILLDQQRVARSLLNLQLKMVRNHRKSLFGSVNVESAKPEDHEDAFEPMNTIIDQGLQDIAQLDAQARRLSGSLSELLQLKQAHYNAFELEFSRDLALDAAKQGRAVLVFTIVTIVFSPLSFVAAFFTMNLTVFPEKLSLSYVSQYIFGFGFAVAVPCIALAFSLGRWTSSWKRVKGALYDTGSMSAIGRDAREKDESLSLPVPFEATQITGQLPDKSTAILQGNEQRLSPSLRGDPGHETPRMTAGLKRRWRSWRNPEVTALPR